MSTGSELLPCRPEVSLSEQESEIVPIEEADDIIEVLSSELARSVLSCLYDTPAPASEIATQVNTSLQNTAYHLDRLESAGVVTVVDTCYSSKGKKMNVYGPTKAPLILVSGQSSNVRAIAENIDKIKF